MEDTTRTTDTKRDILRFYFIIKQLQETNSIRYLVIGYLLKLFDYF